MLTQAKRGTMAGVTLALIVFAGWQLLGWGGPQVTHIAGAVGAVSHRQFIRIRKRRDRRVRGSRAPASRWACLAAGLACWLMGDIYRAYVVLGDPTQPSAPWLGEFGRLLFPVGGKR